MPHTEKVYQSAIGDATDETCARQRIGGGIWLFHLHAGAKGKWVAGVAPTDAVAFEDRTAGEGNAEVEEGVPHVGAVVVAHGEVVDRPAFAPVAGEVIDHDDALAIREAVALKEDVGECGEADVQVVVDVVAVDPDRRRV